MLYTILRPITRVVLQGYYKKIFVNGQQRIPKDKPVILAVNHPSAFTEPCILATHLERELHFLIRGDIINPRVKWFFDETNQLPIYRFQDGFSSMRQNEKQFSYCFDLLARLGCIVIFAEGSTKHVKHTRPIQKGAARIAFGALQNRDIDDVWIVPVGVNFEHSPRPRSVVAVEIGEPISTRDYFSSYEEDERNGLSGLTQAIYDGLKPQMIHIEKSDRLRVTNDLLTYASNDVQYSAYPVAEYGNNSFFTHLDDTAHKINGLTDSQWTEVTERNRLYQEGLKSEQLTDGGSRLYKNSKMWWLLLTPLALTGWVFLGPANWLALTLQKRLNQKDEYISGFRMAGMLVFLPVFLLLWMLILSLFLGWWVIALLLILPVLSMIALWWLDAVKLWNNQQKWKKLPETKLEDLLKMRTQLRDIDLR